MRKTDRIYVAGHRGMVGSALVRGLERRGYANIVMADRAVLDATRRRCGRSWRRRSRMW